MRHNGLALAAVLLSATTLPGQQPQPQPQQQQQPSAAAPVLDPARNRLDALLIQWEQKMQGIVSLVGGTEQYPVTRITWDKINSRKDVFEGTAKYMKPNLAMLEMRKKSKPDIYEKFICTGTFLYEYVPSSKIIRVHEMPPPKPGQVADDNFLSFLFGMKAEEAKRRYDMTLVKEDQHYHYMEILPRFATDKADFQRARLVLGKNTFLPRQLWFEQPNGDEITWDIPVLQQNAAINRSDFTAPTKPAGWELVRQPPAPRVVRPQR